VDRRGRRERPDLPASSTLYWRVTAMDAADAVTSSPSAVQSFVTTATG
jgi:hypothetical protein